MNTKVSLKANYIYNVIYQLSAVLVPLITTPYVSRILNADGVGIYSYTLSIVTYFSMFATMGVAVYGQLEIAAHRDDEDLKGKILLEILIARCLTSIVMLIFYAFFIVITPQYKAMYCVLVLNIVGSMIDVSWYFQGLELFKLTATRNMIIKISGAALIFLFVHEKSDLLKYAFILQGTYFLGNLSLWPYLRKTIHVFPLKSLKIMRHWKNSIIYFIPSFATSIYTVLDKSMIRWITGSEFQNGYYEQAHKIEQILVAIVTSMGAVTMPRVAYLLKKNLHVEAKKIINGATEFVIVLALPMMFGLLTISKYLVPWFLGESYENCIPLLQIFSILMLVVGLDNTVGKQCLMASGKQKHFNQGVMIGAVVNVVLNIVLIPHFEAVGAAIASVVAEIVILTIFVIHSRKLLNISGMFKAIFKYGTYSIIMSIIAYNAAEIFAKSYFQGIIIEIVVAVVVYVSLLLIFRDRMLKQGIKMVTNKMKISKLK